MNELTVLAQEATHAAPVAYQPEVAKALMAGWALGMAALALGWIGANYMKALGRNPEAGKAAGQIIVLAALVEVTALLTFVMASFLL